MIVTIWIALVLFGGSKIPEVGRSLGQAIREFKRGVETADAPAGPPNRPGPDGPKST